MNNYNDNVYDPFQTPKFKRPNKVPNMYPLNQINSNKQQEEINNQTHVNKQHQQQEEEEEEKEGKYNIEIEQFKDKIKTLIIEIEKIKNYQDTQKSDNEIRLEEENQYLKSKYRELKEFSNIQDQLINNQHREITTMKQKNESQQQQIDSLYDANNKSKLFSSELLIKNADLQKRILLLDDQVSKYQDGTVEQTDNEKRLNLKLGHLQAINNKLSTRDNERIKQITLLDNQLKEKKIEVDTCNLQCNLLQSQLAKSQSEVKESFSVLKEMEQVILNFKTVTDERDSEISLLKQSTEELQVELYTTENKYREILMNKGTVTEDQTIGIAKKESKLIAQQVLNVVQLFGKIESTLILPNGVVGLGGSIFFNENYPPNNHNPIGTEHRQNFENISNITDQSPLLNSLRLIREELSNLNNLISRKCNQLMQFTESGQEFSINPTNCFTQ